MTNLKAVFFDMYGTLAGFDPPREQIQAQAVDKFGLDVTKEGIDAGYHLADEFMTSQNSQKPECGSRRRGNSPIRGSSSRPP